MCDWRAGAHALVPTEVIKVRERLARRTYLSVPTTVVRPVLAQIFGPGFVKAPIQLFGAIQLLVDGLSNLAPRSAEFRPKIFEAWDSKW